MTPVDCETLQRAYDDLSPFEKAAVDKRLAKYTGATEAAAPTPDKGALEMLTGNPWVWAGGLAAIWWWWIR
jgi:hypothetical protein